MNHREIAAHVESAFAESAEVFARSASMAPPVARAAEGIIEAIRAGGKLLVFGNGGSAADAQHICGELVGRFKRERRGLPAIALTTDTSILTAVGNDYGFDRVFERQVEALCRAGDVALGISTSGNAENVLRGIEKARQLRAFTIGLTGGDGGRLARTADLALVVPSGDTPRIQQVHITIGHILCDLVESALAE
jgi:D-sedoheptulose 7-phosphate isomerase